MRITLPALTIPAIALALLHCGSSEEASPADAGDADRAAAPGTLDGMGGTSDAGRVDAGSGGHDGDTVRQGDGGGGGPSADGGTGAAKSASSWASTHSSPTRPPDLAPIGVVREYHNWGWLGNNYNEQAVSRIRSTPRTFPPSCGTGMGSSLICSAKGVSGFPAIQGTRGLSCDGVRASGSGQPHRGRDLHRSRRDDVPDRRAMGQREASRHEAEARTGPDASERPRNRGVLRGLQRARQREGLHRRRLRGHGERGLRRRSVAPRDHHRREERSIRTPSS